MRECQEKTTAFLSKGKVTMPNNLNTSSDGYRVTAAQFAVKAIANTPRSPRFLLVSGPEAPIARGRNQQTFCGNSRHHSCYMKAGWC